MKIRKIKKYISVFSVISAILATAAVIILNVCKSNASLADSLNSSICMWIRRGMAFISNLVPFSLFEVLMCLIPALITLLIYTAVRSFKSGYGKIKYIFNLFGIVLTIFTFYVFTLAIPYHTTTLSDNMEIKNVEVTSENLYTTANILIDEINALTESVTYFGGESQMGYDMDTLSEKLSVAYARIAESEGLFPVMKSMAKPIHSSEVMSYFSLLGIYTFFTGESNINTAYPDYDRPFTTAHEFAHQRGIMREEEANFLAFLVCIGSDDDFIKYSGYLRMYEYIISALYRTDEELWLKAASRLDERAVSDIKASNAVAEKYGQTFIADISDKLNDLYLKQNGTAGIVSYGLVTRLTVSYYSEQ